MKVKSLAVLISALILAAAVFTGLQVTGGSGEMENSVGPRAETAQLTYIWSVDFLDIQRIEISLEDRGMSEAWVLGDDGYYYFEGPEGSVVDIDRWGGGIPLLLGGPAAQREIGEVAQDRLEVYGLYEPQMRIDLETGDGPVAVEIGDMTPTEMGYYIRLAGSSQVFTVDYTWFNVMENLVLDPPYPK